LNHYLKYREKSALPQVNMRFYHATIENKTHLEARKNVMKKRIQTIKNNLKAIVKKFLDIYNGTMYFK